MFGQTLTRAAVAMALASVAMAATADPILGRLTVTGTGEVELRPDMATVAMGVETRGNTALEATRDASARIAAVLKLLADAGVAPEDVQTSGLSLGPVYEAQRSDVDRPPRILGFETSNTLTVVVRDLDKLGTLLDAVIAGGANSFRGVTFGLQDPNLAEDDARREAVADALAKASLLAEAAGARRGPILSITEAGAAMPQPKFSARFAMADAAVPMAPGSLTVGADVTIVFALQQ